MHLYKILHQEDIANLPTEGQFQLEVYLPNAFIPIETHQGNCLIRAVACSFPNLRSVDGNLSIDGAEAALPMLTEVKGNFTIHEENTQVPLLQRVGEMLTVLKRVQLDNLEYVGKKIKTKPKISLPKLAIIPNAVYDIQSQADIDRLPIEGGYFGVTVSVDNVTFPQEKILGNIVVKSYNVSFPNLKIAQNITIERLKNENSIVFPKLQQLLGSCNVLGGTAFFPELEQIEKRLDIGYSVRNIKMPKLQTVDTFLSNCSHQQLFFPKLQTVKKKFHCANFTSPNILPVNIAATYKKSGDSLAFFLTGCLILVIFQIKSLSLFSQLVVAVAVLFLLWFIKEIYVKKDNKLIPPDKISFPNLTHIGESVTLSDDYPFPKLETVGIVSLAASDTVFPNIKQIGKLEFQDNTRLNIRLDELFPSLQKIQETLSIGETKPIEKKVETFVYRVSDNLCLSTKEFLVATSWATNVAPRFPLNTLISILKMRHSSFQNFLTREVEREWQSQEPHFEAVLSNLERQWAKPPKYTFEDIFKIQDRNLRRHCFNYIGVSTMMEALEATRIASDGIELNYFKYDLEGNKIPFRKHNIFEVYEADVSKISELRRWGQEKQTVYAVKCWCTSTQNEHWLWIEEAYKNDPLSAIASTFRIHEDVIPHIQCLKRQGDVLVCEMKKEVIPKGSIRPLTKQEYFNLLVAET